MKLHVPIYGTLTEKDIKRFWGKVALRGQDECWTWTASVDGLGRYGQFSLCTRSVSAHRVAWCIEHDRSIPLDMQVLHTCDNPPCVNPAHLWLGTQNDNVQDMARKQRGTSLLSAGAVLEIRRLYAEGGVTHLDLAFQFGVGETTIEAIIKRRTWRYI